MPLVENTRQCVKAYYDVRRNVYDNLIHGNSNLLI